jgi:hypothetical protein
MAYSKLACLPLFCALLFSSGCFLSTGDDDSGKSCVSSCDDTHGSCVVSCAKNDNSCVLSCDGERDKCEKDCK